MKPLKINIISISLTVVFVLASCVEQKKSERANESLTDSIANDIKQSSAHTPDSAGTVDKKLDSLLSKLVQNSEKSLPQDPQEIDSQLRIKNGMVAVEVTYDQQQVSPQSLKAFKELGGQVDTVFQNKLYGWVPIDKIRLAAEPEVVWTLSAATRVAYPAADKDVDDKVGSTDGKPVSESTNVKKEGNDENK